jgi:hypothetical protein
MVINADFEIMLKEMIAVCFKVQVPGGTDGNSQSGCRPPVRESNPELSYYETGLLTGRPWFLVVSLLVRGSVIAESV